MRQYQEDQRGPLFDHVKQNLLRSFRDQGFEASGQGVPGNCDWKDPQAAVAVAPISGVAVSVGVGVRSMLLAASVGAGIQVGQSGGIASSGGQASTFTGAGHT